MVNRQPFFHRNIVYAMLSKYVWDNIAQENYLCNIGLERTDMFSQENNLRNVVLVCLGQHCIKQLRTQCTKCWPTVHSLVSVVQIWLKQHWKKNYLCNIGPVQIVIFSWKTVLSWSAWTNITQENYLCNVGPQSTNNFGQKNNLKFCLDISGPTLHKEITCAMLVHG